MEIDEIVEAIKLSRISKVWKDPVKARNYGEGGWLIALFLGMFLVFTIFIWDIEKDFDKDDIIELDKFKKIAYQNMNCDSLKRTLLDVEDLPYSSLVIDLQSQILARCY